MEHSCVRCVREAWDSVEEPQEPRQTLQDHRPWALPLYPGLGRLTWDQQDLNQELNSGPCGLLRQHCLLHGPSAQNTCSWGTELPAPDGTPKSQEPETSPGAGGPTSKTQEPEKQEPLLPSPDPGPCSELLHSVLCHLISDGQDTDRELHSGPCGLRPEDCLLPGPNAQNTSNPSTEPPTPHPMPKSPAPETPKIQDPEPPPGVEGPTPKSLEPESPSSVEDPTPPAIEDPTPRSQEPETPPGVEAAAQKPG
uniref:Uncharacterized protein n=1 Tax=Myotis myotis TaxID=51298 RepID=A0A7J7Y0V3_MYOMY|nr:hypothetical protein mMyoMyo1_011399 [Myotis myotis]